MLDVHSRIHNFKKNVTREERKEKPNSFDPIPPVAESILEECCLLCFDEFQVLFSQSISKIPFFALLNV